MRSFTMIAFVAMFIVALSCFVPAFASSYSFYVGGVQQTVVDDGTAPLYKYVEATDPNAGFVVDSVVYNATLDATIHTLNVTSLEWLNSSFVSCGNTNVWSHQVTIVRPSNAQMTNLASVYLTGGTVGTAASEASYFNTEFADIYTNGLFAANFSGIFVMVTNLPYQPCTFTDLTSSPDLTEDNLIAKTWGKILSDSSAPIDYNGYFPMVKAGKTVLDVLESYSATLVQAGSWDVALSQFYLLGASKRGAATWLLLAYESSKTDARVIGAAPMSFTLLNDYETLQAMVKNLGGLSFAFTYYVTYASIQDYLGDETALSVLANQIDPLSSHYITNTQRFPKLVVSGTADQFFLPTNDKTYWSQLKNAQRFFAPDAQHSLAERLPLVMQAIGSHIIASYNEAVINISYTIDYDYNLISIKSKILPTTVTAYRGLTNPFNPTSVDFRAQKVIQLTTGTCPAPAYALTSTLCENPITFASYDVSNDGWYNWADLTWNFNWYESSVTADRYTSIFFTAEFTNTVVADKSYFVSTPMMILPDELPFYGCESNCTSLSLV